MMTCHIDKKLLLGECFCKRPSLTEPIDSFPALNSILIVNHHIADVFVSGFTPHLVMLDMIAVQQTHSFEYVIK
jgi:hypothetical protein